MKSPFRYPGSKAALRKKVMTLAPADYAEFREPFVGGGSIFFSVPKEKRRWINDLDESLISVYLALRDRPGDFFRACKQIKPQEDGESDERLKAVFERFAQAGEMDRALRFFFLNRTCFGGRVNDDEPSSLYFTHPEGWNIVNTDRLWEAAGLLRHVKITMGNYLELLQAPGEGVWCYLDPPYVVNNKVSSQRRLYRHIFTEEQHVQFAEHVRVCPHNVLVSYDDCPLIRRLYSDSRIRIEPVRVPYRMGDGQNRVKHELLISNYDPPRPQQAGVLVSLARW